MLNICVGFDCAWDVLVTIGLKLIRTAVIAGLQAGRSYKYIYAIASLLPSSGWLIVSFILFVPVRIPEYGYNSKDSTL